MKLKLKEMLKNKNKKLFKSGCRQGAKLAQMQTVTIGVIYDVVAVATATAEVGQRIGGTCCLGS